MKKNTMNILKNSSVLLISILICLLFGEIIARVVTKITFKKKMLPTPPALIYNESEINYVPNWNGVCCGLFYHAKKYKVTTNSMGLREKELPLKKGNKIYRLLFLGDSITFGLGVEVDATFVRIIENLLNTSSYDKGFETVNAGISGASSIQEISLLKKTGIKYQPDIVVLDFYLNDILIPETYDTKTNQEINQQWKDFLKYEIPIPFKKFFATKSELYKILIRSYRDLLLRMGLVATPLSAWWTPAFVNRKDWQKDKKVFYELMNQPNMEKAYGSVSEPAYYDNFRKHIREIKELGKTEKFKLIIVCFPIYFQVATEFLENEPQQRLAKVAQEENISFFDILPFLRAEKEKNFYLDFCHLNEEGHKFVAEKIYEFLKGNL